VRNIGHALRRATEQIVMPEFFRDQPTPRWMIGAAITAIVWALYVVRASVGVGPMRDYEGNQAPSLHYLAGALVVTGMVATWIIVRAIMTRRQGPSRKPTEPRA
jgi:hypothetical protein